MTETFNIPEQGGPPAEPVSIVPDQSAVDPAAPYGRFANGKPRKAPPKAEKPRAAAAPKASTPRSSAKKAQATDFRPVVEQALHMLSVGFMGLGRHNRAFLADAATIQINAKDGAHVVNEMAKINPTLERLLTTSAPAVPYMELGNFLFTMGVQLAANHGKVVPGVKVFDPEELATSMERQMSKAREQQEQQAEQQERQAAEQHEYAAA